MNTKYILRLLVCTFLFLQFSCVKDDFDEPPVNGEDPSIASEDIVSLEEVLSKWTLGGFTKIDLDKYVQALVVADDASGSFYKQIVVEDENSDLGISIIIDENNIGATFPIGRRVFVNLKDLWISDYNGLPQIGYIPAIDISTGDKELAPIPSILVPEVLLGGTYNNTVTPREVTDLTLLGTSALNTLIKIKDVQFTSQSVGQTWADPVAKRSVNHNIEDCRKNTMVLRASGFAQFAGEMIPEGKGDLVCIYGIFGNTRQLTVRNTSDAPLTNPRCGAGGGGTEKKSIADIRALFTGSTTYGPDAFIEGTVISDYVNQNITGRNLVLQDETGGIVVRFDANHTYGLGEKLKISVQDIEISEFNGSLQINNVPSDSPTKLGTGAIAPKVLTVKEILDDFERYESTLVQIANPTFEGNVFNSDLILKDATGTIDVFTRNSATFSGQGVPATVKTLTAIVGEFSNNGFGPQLTLRNLDDVDGEGGVDPNPTEGIDEAFSAGSDNQDIDIKDWVNVAVKGTRKWIKKTFSGNGYAQMSTFQDTNPEAEAWLVTPEIDATKYKNLSFESAMAFFMHDGLTVYLTDNFTGDVTTTTWSKLSPSLANSGSGDNNWVASGDIDISAGGSKARVAFVYVGNSSPNTTTFRIDNVKIK